MLSGMESRYAHVLGQFSWKLGIRGSHPCSGLLSSNTYTFLTFVTPKRTTAGRCLDSEVSCASPPESSREKEHCSMLTSIVNIGPDVRASLFSPDALVSEGSLKLPGGCN